MNEFVAMIDPVIDDRCSGITGFLVVIVGLDQKTKHARWEMNVFQKYALHESIVIVGPCWWHQ